MKRTILRSIERKLARRYPGIECRAMVCTDNDKYFGPGGRQWVVEFLSKDREALIRAGLATAEQFELQRSLTVAQRARHPSRYDELGNHISVYNARGDDGIYMVCKYIFDGVERRPYTKKFQAQVSRMLKPFVRGTWKPQGVRS